ncbi:MAG TPA: type II secretion system protein [Candidatus Rifleibacterium sp.]|nr:type II secretion system protein [Candidatus Rifleibacterium sp.]HPT44399.1 type II secretion system protein [Candidatus Rifleibacterium sp.]
MPGKRSSGFSLFEMLLVIALIGLLATATLPVAELMFVKAKESELENNLAAIRQAISLWKRDCRNATVKQYGYNNLYLIPDSCLAPPSLRALMRPDLEFAGGKFEVLDKDGVTVRANFYPKPYLNNIPIDPFVGAATWNIYYASGTSTAVFEGGAVTGGDPVGHRGVFDISCVDNTGNRRRGFVQAIDGTNYTDW